MQKITQLPWTFIVNGPPWEFDATEVPRERLLTHWLIHSCLYYEMDSSVITDHEFDELAKLLAFYWEECASHPHAYLVAIEDGEAQTKSGFYIKQFPSIVRSCAKRLLTGELRTLNQ